MRTDKRLAVQNRGFSKHIQYKTLTQLTVSFYNLTGVPWHSWCKPSIKASKVHWRQSYTETNYHYQMGKY